MKNNIRISASFACADPLNLESDLRKLEQAQIELLHIDIMDGSFVPNFGLNLDVVKALKAKTDIPLECHLMVNDPERYVEALAQRGVSYVTIHYEAATHVHRALSQIRKMGMKAGVALNPATPLNVLEYLLDEMDCLTMMMINPGFAGQRLIPDMMRKLKDARQFLESHGRGDMDIIVDGNVSIENIPGMVQAGATILVGGTSSIFRKGIDIVDSANYVRTLY